MGMPPDLAAYKPTKRMQGANDGHGVDMSKDPAAEERWRQLVSVADGFDRHLSDLAAKHNPTFPPYVPESAAKRLKALHVTLGKYLAALGAGEGKSPDQLLKEKYPNAGRIA